MVGDHQAVSPAETALRQRYPLFGVNKQREMVRLIIEISRREKIDTMAMIAGLPVAPVRFQQVKSMLLSRRFPHLTAEEKKRYPLRKILPPVQDFVLPPGAANDFLPNKIIIEAAVAHSDLAKKAQRSFGKAKVEIVPTLKDYLAERTFSVADYARRRETLILVEERGLFEMACPCTPGASGCGYSVLNLGQGCIYDCVYCFLQAYVNSPGIIIPANVNAFLARYQPRAKRIGSGEFSDSLALDHVTEFSPRLAHFFKQQPSCVFEFKTKCSNVAALLAERGADNLVVGWSLNTPRIVESAEYGAADLSQRLDAASRCLSAGYRVAFHFDPIVFYPGWDDEYRSVVDQLFRVIDAARIAWISLGTLRMTVDLKQAIEARFPGHELLDGELTSGFDGKLRYASHVRPVIYRRMIESIRRHSSAVPLYLCMEDDAMVRAVNCPACF